MEGDVVCANQLIHYKKEGDFGLTLLLLHGWGQSSNVFQNLAPAILKKGCTVVIPDLPGFGKSELPKKPFSVDDYANTVFEFIKKMKITEPLVLAGHSFGGRISIKMAVKHSEMFSKLILINCAGISQRKTLKNLALRAIAKIGKKIFKLRGFSAFEPKVRKFFYCAFGSEDYFASGELAETFKKIIAEDLSDIASKTALETLILWGENDETTPVSDAQKFHSVIKNSKLVVLKNAGHFSFLDQPEKFQEVFLSFL